MSKKHLHRYVAEFAGRHNVRPLDTIDQMKRLAADMEGKRLTYKALIADNGLPSGRTGITITRSLSSSSAQFENNTEEGLYLVICTRPTRTIVHSQATADRRSAVDAGIKASPKEVGEAMFRAADLKGGASRSRSRNNQDTISAYKAIQSTKSVT